jgi:sigma-B regulation protein RsbU (phosphoserine phosphatase)
VDGATRAIERLQKSHFHVALIDVQLIDGDGYSLCQQVRASSPGTDVILMTGSLSEPDEKLFLSLEKEAFYFLFKPFERRVLRALVSRCLQLQKERRAKEEHARELAEDLERARQFQSSLMPREALDEDRWHLEGRFQPCDALGGDFYVSLINRDGTIAFAIADVVGHGVGAAMYGGMLLSVLDAARRRHPDPARVLPELTSGIDFFEASRYASLIYGQLFPNGKLRYFNAGHPPALWQRRDGRFEELEPTGVILSSLLPQDATEVREVRIEPGERVLTFTDGVYEVRDPSDREYERTGVLKFMENHRNSSVSDTLDRLLADVREHGAGRPFDDDVTALLIERR